jgi:hypothetical protein
VLMTVAVAVAVAVVAVGDIVSAHRCTVFLG